MGLEKEFPEEGCCLSTNKIIFEFLKNSREEDYRLFDEIIYKGIAWNTKLVWGFKYNCSKKEYTEEDILNYIDKQPSKYQLDFESLPSRGKLYKELQTINNLNQNKNGKSTEVGAIVPRITNRSRTTGSCISGRTSKYSVTIGSPSNKTISC